MFACLLAFAWAADPGAHHVPPRADGRSEHLVQADGAQMESTSGIIYCEEAYVDAAMEDLKMFANIAGCVLA